MKRLFNIFLISLVFFGSIGVPLYSHTCLHEHQTFSTLFVPSDHCEKKVLETIQKDCCGKPIESEKKLDANCCVDFHTQLQLPFSFVEISSVSVFVVPEVFKLQDYLPFYKNLPKPEALANARNADPPPLAVNERLPRICVWRL